jgi:LuxR family transcriptional regulator, maltose regulon positive regulatory protein
MAATTLADAGIALGKVRLPGLPADLVSRPRLGDRINRTSCPVVLVSAPAGFGKTVAVLDWLRSEGCASVWLSLDPLDNDPHRFCAHLAAAVEALGGELAQRAAPLIRSAALAPASGLPTEALHALFKTGKDLVIVLDDLHAIDSPRLIALLQDLMQQVAELDQGNRLVAITRHDPPIPLGRLRVSGRLVEVREEDLRFTELEARSFFEALLPGLLEPEDVKRLEERTEGWAAGLRMAAIALNGAPDPRTAVESFTGSHRFVVDYLLTEAFGRQREEVQEFLLETSILSSFTAATCAAVTGNPSAADRLAEIERANLFLVPLGEAGQWFRYHHVFAELLRFRLERQRPQALDGLHERASRWYEGAGDLHRAIEHAASMTNRTRLVQLIDAHGYPILARSELASLSRWFAQVPKPVAWPYPQFLLVLAWFRCLTERAPDLEPVLDAADSALDRMEIEGTSPGRDNLRVRVAILRAFAARFSGKLDDAIRIGDEVLPRIADEDATSRGQLLYNQARVHATLGEMEPAARLLERSFEENLRAGTHYLILTGLGQTGAVKVELEGVGPAIESLSAAAAFATARGLDRVPAYSAILYQLGRAHMVGDDLNRAEQMLERALQLATAGGMPEGEAHALINLARLRSSQYAFGTARDLLGRADALSRGHNAVLWDTTIELERCRLAFQAALAGAGEFAPPPTPDRDERWTVVTEAWTTLRLVQALRDPQSAGDPVELAERLLHESEQRGRGITTAVGMVALAALSNGPRRWELLSAGLELAARRGYVRPLLDLGEPARNLLLAGMDRRISAPARRQARLLLDRFELRSRQERFGGSAQLVISSDAAGANALLASLTSREMDVLTRLADGGSNKVIARALHVTPETVKTHLSHVYAKLGVRGRREAVIRARELGIRPPG